jgi:aquaglyceroporin related protein
MVAPFLGCAFGGFLYDIFIYTGPSPINSPWLGLKQLTPWNAMRARREHIRYKSLFFSEVLVSCNIDHANV